METDSYSLAKAQLPRWQESRAGWAPNKGCRMDSFRGCAVGDVPATIAADPDVGLFGVADKTFQHAQARAIGADLGGRFVRDHLLVGMRLQEFADPQAPGISACLPRRQRMVRSDHLVAIRDIGTGTEEQGAVGVHVLQEPVVAIGHDLDMLGGAVVGNGEMLLIAVTGNHFAVIPPGNTG